MEIDVFCHIIPPKFVEAVERLTPELGPPIRSHIGEVPTLLDWEQRFRIMDQYPGYVQILTVALFHHVAYRKEGVELARIANDEMAELVFRYPDRFVAGIACLPMNNMDDTLAEVDRAVNDLKLRGVEVWAQRNEKPLDYPEFMPLYEKMSRYNLPILIHPIRGPAVADYSCEKESKYRIFSIFGWPYDTTVAMTRLVFSGVLEKIPNLKLVTHHCGGMVPFFADRIISHCNYNEMRRLNEKHNQGLSKHPIEYFRMFYNDTALNGGALSLMCGYDFFGADRLLFATDLPYDAQIGDSSICKTIEAIEQMSIPDLDKKKIFEENARNLFRLPI